MHWTFTCLSVFAKMWICTNIHSAIILLDLVGKGRIRWNKITLWRSHYEKRTFLFPFLQLLIFYFTKFYKNICTKQYRKFLLCQSISSIDRFAFRIVCNNVLMYLLSIAKYTNWLKSNIKATINKIIVLSMDKKSQKLYVIYTYRFRKYHIVYL